MADITVVGGGLAGLVASIASAEAGAKVHLGTEHPGLVSEGRVAEGMRRLDEASAAAVGGELHDLTAILAMASATSRRRRTSGSVPACRRPSRRRPGAAPGRPARPSPPSR
jgi:glucose inhibited division protein A